MTAKYFYVKVRYIKRKSGFKRYGSGKGKKMFTVIDSSYLNLESLINAPFDPKKERGFRFVYSDKNKLEKNAVAREAGLSNE